MSREKIRTLDTLSKLLQATANTALHFKMSELNCNYKDGFPQVFLDVF